MAGEKPWSSRTRVAKGETSGMADGIVDMPSLEKIYTVATSTFVLGTILSNCAEQTAS